MPSFVPSSPFVVLAVSVAIVSLVLVAARRWRRSELDLDVDVRRKVETHERIDGLRGRVNDVDEPLVGAFFEVLAAVLVLVRGTDHGSHVLLGGERPGADHRRASTSDRIHDLARRAVDDLVVIRLKSDADLLSR